MPTKISLYERKVYRTLLDLKYKPKIDFYFQASHPDLGRRAFDFYIPQHRQIIEVHGRQHYEEVLAFHSSRSEFLALVKRDEEKKQWAIKHKFGYIALPYDSPLRLAVLSLLIQLGESDRIKRYISKVELLSLGIYL